MTTGRYVKVTLKEFKAIRAAVTSSYIQSGCWDNQEQDDEIIKAEAASIAIERRNKLTTKE